MRLTIRSVAVRRLNLVPTRATETASGAMTTTPLVLIDVRTAEGVIGRSYVRCYTPLALDPLTQLLDNVGRLLEGSSAAPRSVAKKLGQQFRLVGAQGLTGIAMAGIDMALWDAQARACDVPLVTLLGGEPGPVPAYASLRSMNPRAVGAEAGELLEKGFTAFKVKVGGRDLAADLDAIRALRMAVGDGCRLMVDYNQSLAVHEAIERVRVLDGEGLHWIEEPTRADDFDGHARIAAAADTAVQLGESWWGPDDMAKSIAARASDHVMLDVMKLGGVTGWLTAMGLARTAGLPVSSHAFPEYSSHLLAVTPTAHYLEYLDHAGPILAEPVRVRDGHVVIPDGPGAGVEWDEVAIRRLEQDGST